MQVKIIRKLGDQSLLVHFKEHLYTKFTDWLMNNLFLLNYFITLLNFIKLNKQDKLSDVNDELWVVTKEQDCRYKWWK